MGNEEKQQFLYKYPNESFSGCDMVATAVYSWDAISDNTDKEPESKTSKSNNSILKNKRFATHALGEIQTISYSIHMEKRPVRSIGNVNAKDYVMGPRTIAGSLVFAVFNRHFAKKMMAEHNDYFKKGEAFLVDEIPPFDIVISMANEYGLRSKMVIYGVRLLNEGQVMSVNDVFTENTYQFMATDVEYLNDELTYESNRKGSMFILEDTKLKKEEEKKNRIPSIDGSLNNNDNTEKIEDIKLSVSTKNATRVNQNGFASLSLYPIQYSGHIKITNSKNIETLIAVNGNSLYSIMLEPDIYQASFTKEDLSKWKCNTSIFSIKEFANKYDMKRYAPIIEVITDSSLQIYSNDPTHTHVKINSGTNTIDTFYELKSRRVIINNLTSEKEYILSTCTGPDTICSPEIKVKTFNSFYKPFNDFIKLIETNQHLLLYKELKRYIDIVEEAKQLSINMSNYQSPTNSIVILKDRYEKEFKSLNNEDENYHDKYAELKCKILICNELIYLSAKVQNNIISVVNKKCEIKTPEIKIDSTYNNFFVFDKNTTKAEFYRVYKNLTQSASNVDGNILTTIEGYDNAFKFLGKSGVNHYVQGIVDSARSPKLEFYEMTVKEKQDFISKLSNENIISPAEQNRIESIVSDEIGHSLDSKVIERAFIHKIKFNENFKINDPFIEKIEEDKITIKNATFNLLNNKKISDFYLTIATKNDITDNDFLYKCKFSNIDKEIVLNDVDYAIYKDKSYGAWIEDSEFNQISNATTFNMSSEEHNIDRDLFQYEYKHIIQEIKNRLKNVLPLSTFLNLSSDLEYDEEINKFNIIDKTIKLILSSGLGSITINNCLRSIKEYIGIINSSYVELNNLNFESNTVSFSNDKECSLVIIAIDTMQFNYYNKHITSDVEIDINSIKADYLLIFTLSYDLNNKSQILFINKNINKLEVL